MPIPPIILNQIIKVVVELAKSAVMGGKIVKKIDLFKIGGLTAQIIRRVSLGRDKGISQVIKIYKNGIIQEVWQIVVKSDQVIHKHLKYRRK